MLCFLLFLLDILILKFDIITLIYQILDTVILIY